MTEWQQEPRPVRGWALICLGFALRAWALPVVLVAWVVGVLVQACEFGWSLVFDDPIMLRGAALIEGKRHRQKAKLDAYRRFSLGKCADEDIDDDWDDIDDDWDEDDL